MNRIKNVIKLRFQIKRMIHQQFWSKRMKTANGLRWLPWNIWPWAIFLPQFYWPHWVPFTVSIRMVTLQSSNYIIRLNLCKQIRSIKELENSNSWEETKKSFRAEIWIVTLHKRMISFQITMESADKFVFNFNIKTLHIALA